MPPEGYWEYSPAKWALENTYSSLREELKTNNVTVDVIVVRTLKNKYSKVWIHEYGDDPGYVAKYIFTIIQNPANKRHFLPKHYYFVRFTERLLPEIFNFKNLKTLYIKRKIRFSQYTVKNVLITGASSGLGKELARCYSKSSQNLFLIDRDYGSIRKYLNSDNNSIFYSEPDNFLNCVTKYKNTSKSKFINTNIKLLNKIFYNIIISAIE